MQVNLAVGSDGSKYFNVQHGSGTSASFLVCLKQLVIQLDSEKPGWRKTHVLMIDNAATHTSYEAQSEMAKLDLPVLYTAPGSYLVSPVERAFKFLKNSDLMSEEWKNKLDVETLANEGRRLLKAEKLAINIGARLSKLTGNHIKSMFRDSFLRLSDYLELIQM